MPFPIHRRYFWVMGFIFVGAFVLFIHNGYADKSALSEPEGAYDAPIDITDREQLDPLPVEDVQDDMFPNETEMQTESPAETNSTKSLKQRWKEGRELRKKEKEYHVKNFENDLVIRTQNGEDHYFSIELAIHPKNQARGLMFRKAMPSMHGMLFVFDSSAQRSFWMKNTLIPLDIIFIGQDGRINHIHHNAKPLDESMISSLGPAKAALEINGGMSHDLGLNVGDKILHTAFKNRHME